MSAGERYVTRGKGAVVHAVDANEPRSICGLLSVEAGGGWGGSKPSAGPATCVRCLDEIARRAAALRSREGDGEGLVRTRLSESLRDARIAIEAAEGVMALTAPGALYGRSAPQPAPSLDAWLEEPRTGAETRAEAARRLGDLASRLSGEDRVLVAFASGMLSGPQPEPEAGEGWRPIESAPKDGTVVLVYGGTYTAEGDETYNSHVLDTVREARCSAGEWCLGYGKGGSERWAEPKWWRPLPAPPVTTEGDDA